MGANVHGPIRRRGAADRRLDEIEWLLQAIAGAIATGGLPPSDACAWARIAASEVKLLQRLATSPRETSGTGEKEAVPYGGM